jgi:hypothetical protein
MAPRKPAAKKESHAHGCRRCRTRYVDTCRNKAEDGLCINCRGGMAWQLLIDNRAPHRCCIDSRLATKAEKETYSLAGRSNWHICPHCRRTHPFKVTHKEIRKWP